MTQPFTANIDLLSADPISLQTLVDQIPFGITVLDKERKIILVNRAFEALTGFSRDSTAGLPCWHVLRSRHCVKNCPVLKIDGHSELVCVESDIISKDRQLIPIRLNVSALKNTNDGIVGYIETIEDFRPIHKLDLRNNQAFSFSQLIGRSPQMEKIYKILPILAQSDSSVLITGESGTGKDLVAEAIHQESNRAKAPFIKINCGALPENLLESELFGHEKGAFTGAVANKPGRFRLAHNGTLYLTEIGDLPFSLQVKLLTFIDDQVVHPVGGTRGFQVDTRIICGTHRHLEEMVEKGLFREDLFFRLNVVRVHLPPLRERENDCRLLLDHFLANLNSKLNKQISGFMPETLNILNRYHYPGNVRELKNITEYAVNLCPDGKIKPDHLPAYIFEAKVISEPQATQPPLVNKGLLQPELKDSGEQPQTWSGQERKLIMEALLKTGGSRQAAAKILGWGRGKLWRKMKQHQII